MPWQFSTETPSGGFFGPPAESPTRATDEDKNRTAAVAYFQAAKKRIGLLESSILDIQCLFFAHIFERYALRPVSAWTYIQLGCTRLQIYLLRKGRQKRNLSVQVNDTTNSLEQRIFWTCYKAERCVRSLDRCALTRQSLIMFR